MKRLAIIHYLPLEYYPPITNLLDLMANKGKWEINVYTTNNNKGRKIYKNDGECKIDRMRLPDPGKNFLSRIFSYLTFAIRTFISLILFRPHAIVYYESISAGPVYFYMSLIRKHIPLLIHYHEYCSPDWYKNGMRLVKWYHILEKKFLYKKALWISQTNKDRIRLFLKDHPQVDANKIKELPNYPPASWAKGKPFNNKKKSEVTQIVYVGALSLETTYIKEFCEWICEKEGEMRLDVFSYNMTHNARAYLKGINSNCIRFFEEGVEYSDLPVLLTNYDVGVILYKPLIDNFKYNAPNKLFEYMACGLQVWFPGTLVGILPYHKENPLKVLSMDFTSLREKITVSKTLRQNLIKEKYKSYTSEMGLAPLIEVLIEL